MAEHQRSSGDRPSFATFWRNSQTESTAKELTFVQSIPGQMSNKAKSPEDERSRESEQRAKNKRRAQVRKAQVQHRQRKANYIKKLEADIAGIRDDIVEAERQRYALKSENEDMRARLSGPAGFGRAGVPGIEVTPVPPYAVPLLDGGGPVQGFDIDLGGSFGVDSFPAGMGMDDYIGTSTFDALELSPFASSGTTGSSVHGSPQFMDSSGTGSPYPEMAADQPQQALDLFLV